jgi:hypothetical protein
MDVKTNSFKVCERKETMEELFLEEKMTDTMTIEKVDKYSYCSATCNIIYKNGSRKEERMDKRGNRKYF